MRSIVRIAAALLLLSMLAVPVAAQRKSTKHKRHHTSTAAPRALRKKMEQTREKRKEVTQEMRQTKAAVKTVKVDLDKIDGQLDHLERRYDVTVAELVEDQKKQVQVAAQLLTAQNQLVQDTTAVRQRLKSIYVQGELPLISVLLGSASSGDMASRAYLVQRIAARDRDALAQYRSQKADVERKKKEADELVKKVLALKAGQKQQQGELQDLRSDKRSTLEDLEEHKDALQKVLDQIDADEARIEQQIIAATRVSSSHSTTKRGHFSGRLSAPVNAPITSGFGFRFHPILHKTRLHAGIDFGARSGTPIGAAAAGDVIAAQYMNGFGNCVIIDHGGGIATVYGHCSRLSVTTGQHVEKGQHIGNVGQTGLATGPHLHFEVRVNGKPVDPRGWL